MNPMISTVLAWERRLIDEDHRHELASPRPTTGERLTRPAPAPREPSPSWCPPALACAVVGAVGDER